MRVAGERGPAPCTEAAGIVTPTGGAERGPFVSGVFTLARREVREAADRTFRCCCSAQWKWVKNRDEMSEARADTAALMPAVCVATQFGPSLEGREQV